MLKSLLPAVFALLLVATFISGCESNNSFLTKSYIDSHLQGKWDMVRIPYNQSPQLWEFNNGKLYVSEFDSAGLTIVKHDTTGYEIIATIATPYIAFNDPAPGITGRWVIINIDSKYLTINHQSDHTFGTFQREFVKR